MNWFSWFLEEKIMPAAVKVSGQRHLSAIREGFIVFMPFMIIGSLFLIVANFPLPGYSSLMKSIFGAKWDFYVGLPADATFGIMSIFVGTAVAYKLALSYKVDTLAAGITGLVCFLITIPFGVVVGDKVVGAIPAQYIGSRGLFVALLMAIVSVEIFRKIVQKGIVIKMPDGVPPGVARSFAALIPAGCAITVALFIRIGFALTPFETLTGFINATVTAPLSLIGNSLPGAILTVFATTLFWTIGLNGGSITSGFLRPVWMPLQEQNILAIKAGLLPPNIITEQFYDLIWMGGAGATLALVLIMLIKSHSEQYKELSRLAIAPALFNINEPIMFGLPIVLNPLMIIPFSIAPIVMVVINYFAMYFDIVAKPTGVFLPWTTPPLIQGWLVTGSISGSFLQLFDIFVGMAIYLPFIRIMDKRMLAEEHKQSS
ncbi:MAG: PTS cellobiose transporter subunit IIC [Negativicutes bacterium]